MKKFIAAARRYCDLIENANRYEMDKLLPRLAAALAELYGASVNLPDIEPSEYHEPKTIPWDDLPNLPNFGEGATYWEVFDPYEVEAPIEARLENILKEVYADIKGGLITWENSETPANAVWEWHFGLTSHWGAHAVSALRALHWTIEREKWNY